jgi:hypothetical protein
MTERLEKLDKQIAADELGATITLADRYKTNIKYETPADLGAFHKQGRLR